jgi:hypothetical protein
MKLILMMNMTTKETVKDVALATVKGAVGAVPFLGSLFSEYIGLATELIASKRHNEWQNMIDEKLSRIECEMSQIASNSFFYSQWGLIPRPSGRLDFGND